MANAVMMKDSNGGSREAESLPNCGQEKRPAVALKHRESDEQRDHLFHSRCEVNGKILSLVIDGGSCANLISAYAVQKLELKTQKHPKPYHLTWLNEHGDVKVNKQVQIEFGIGKYSDSVLCDVVPMQNAHVLLGRPWQFDKRVLHDGWENSYTLKHEGKKIKLKPMSLDDVYADLKTMEETRDEGKSVRASLWVQRLVGFNFMSLRKLPKVNSVLEHNPCSGLCVASSSSPTKQSANRALVVGSDGDELKSATSTNVLTPTPGTSKVDLMESNLSAFGGSKLGNSSLFWTKNEEKGSLVRTRSSSIRAKLAMQNQFVEESKLLASFESIKNSS